MVVPVGGVPPYNYLWNEGQTTTTIDNLSANTPYAVTITDAVGCELIGETLLTAPDSLILSATFTDANCDGLNTGFINIESNTGGIPPFTYAIDGVSNGSNLVFEDLIAGEYTLEITDVNGCTGELTGSLGDVEIPIIDMGEPFSVELGCEAELRPVVNPISIQSTVWNSTELLTCDTCLNTESFPMFPANYVLTVTSEDGCVRSDSIDIGIIGVRKAFVPNVFSPNFDGINDFFTVFGKPRNVQMIEELVVFDRWGGIVFQQSEFPPNDPNLGWDGTTRGKILDTGVYTYFAKVLFWDQEVLILEGSVMLLR
jgi:gliding motility-associated-like protein